MIKYVFILVLVGVYAHLFLHFFVNPNNECTILKDLSKEEITNNVYTKQPFLFDATGIKSDLTRKEKTVGKRYDRYDVSYRPIPLLEPYVRFEASRFLYETKKRWFETNEDCRTFYRIHKGLFQVTCIHPKYAELAENKKLLNQNKHVIRLTLHEDSILFVPNYWTVVFEPETTKSPETPETKSETPNTTETVETKGTLIEKIQYRTPMNQLAIAISKIFK